MKSQSVLALALVLLGRSIPVQADLWFDDGGVHDVDYAIAGNVHLDHQKPGVQTTLNLLEGGSIGLGLYAYEDSWVAISGGSIGGQVLVFNRNHLTMSSGTINYGLTTYDNSQVTVFGGTITDNGLRAHGNSQVTVFGGTITDDGVGAYDNSDVMITGGVLGPFLYGGGDSRVTMSGGTIGFGGMQLEGQMILAITGFDFAVDGRPVGSGEITSILGGLWWHDPTRVLTGTLANGDPMSDAFQIGDDAKIVLTVVPLPGAALLGAIGLAYAAWRLRRKTA